MQSASTSALFLSALSGSILFTGTGVHAQAAPPFGPSVPGADKNIFYFSPWGSQLDRENTFPNYHVPDTSLPNNVNYNIYDYHIGPGKPLEFDLFLYKTAPQYAGGVQALASFEFTANFDPSEFYFKSFDPALDVLQRCTQVPGVGVAVGILRCEFNAGAFVTNNGGIGVFADPKKLGTFKGVTVIPGLAPHDGVEDFKLTLKELLDNGNPPTNKVPNVDRQFQDVELQVPSPLPMLGALAALGSVRRARKLSSHLKNFSRC